MSASDANTAMLNAAATPFTPSFETDAPYLMEQHLYDTPAAIAQDNEASINFLTVHNAPPQFWEEAGYEDPRLDRLDAPHAGARRLLSVMTEAEYNNPIRACLDRPGVPRLLDAMERDREDRIFRLEKRMDTMHLSSGTSAINAEELIAPTPLASPQSSLRHRQDQGVPLPPSPPWSPAPVRQMVERSQKRKNRKNPMTRSGQRCRPSDKSRQVRMKLKVEVAGLQDRYGFTLFVVLFIYLCIIITANATNVLNYLLVASDVAAGDEDTVTRDNLARLKEGDITDEQFDRVERVNVAKARGKIPGSAIERVWVQAGILSHRGQSGWLLLWSGLESHSPEQTALEFQVGQPIQESWLGGLVISPSSPPPPASASKPSWNSRLANPSRNSWLE
ncbi:hypothetical protein BJ322DRAFT_1113382 [Thelephora terrestris]|uniref:Uncharacterized protein n=1 Tax=Thelephora terrestris TaxID=56493 RepID=A0A9P6H5R1_9AGAM|nr:hypothetical protein BJ322DRAFT_1113382 [Thelephora terrestris]